MRRLARLMTLLGLVAALLILAVPGTASAAKAGDRAFCAPAGAPEPGQCNLTATGNFAFDFDASSGPLGEDPTGTFRVLFGSDAFADYDITCLQVTGNSASFAGVVTSSDILPVGEQTAYTVVDNLVGPDLISGGTSTGGPGDPPVPPGTPNCGDVTTSFNAVDGDIVVQDNAAGKDKKDKDKDKA